MSQQKTSNKVNSPLFKAIICGIIFFCVGLVIAFLRYQVLLEYERNEVQEVLELVEQNMEQTIQDSYTVALTLALTVDENGEVKNFNEVAKNLHENYNSVDVLELVPGGVIEYVYPLEGNESVVGYNILQDPKVNQEVLKAAETGSIYFAGPIDLKQGGRAVIGRLPIVINNELWGFSAVLIYLETLIESSGIPNLQGSQYNFQLSKVNPDTGVEEFFLNTDLGKKNEYSEAINFPEGDWKLYASRKGTQQSQVSFFSILVLAIMCGIIGAYLTYFFFRKPIELEELLQERSAELLKSREDFKKNSDLLSSILESPKQMLIFSLDKEYNFIAFNKGQKDLVKSNLGKTIRQGMNMFDFIPEHKKNEVKQNYDRALSGEYFEDVYVSKLDPDNTRYWESRYSPIKDKNGEIKGLTVFATNITKRVVAEKRLEKNERRYRTLIQNSPFCIHELDLEQSITSMNQAGLGMLCLEKEEEIIGTKYSSFVKSIDKKRIDDLFQRALDGESLEFEFEVKDDTYFQSSFIPIKDNDSNVVRVMGITQDVTERKKSAKTIEQSLKEKTTLLSEIHHRVKNNLAIVSGLLELQRFELNDDKVDAAFEQSINRILSIAMVHELMYQSEDLSSVSVQDYLEKLIPAISATMQEESESINVEINIADTRLNINEAIPLGLMLNELITNSFKYAFDTKENANISISLRENENEISVIYEDNGIGFDESVDFDKPKNLGLNLVHTQLQQLNSTYTADTENKFKLEFTFLYAN